MLLNVLKWTGQPYHNDLLGLKCQQNLGWETLLLVECTSLLHRLWVWPHDLLWTKECEQMWPLFKQRHKVHSCNLVSIELLPFATRISPGEWCLPLLGSEWENSWSQAQACQTQPSHRWPGALQNRSKKCICRYNTTHCWLVRES